MISVRNLTKHYKVPIRPSGLGASLKSVFARKYTQVKAVDNISFSIATGERVGFLGPNGAGKTTTLKMLSGLLHQGSGEVTVDGHIPQRRETAFLKKIMLVMGQKQQLLWDLPPSDTFDLNRAIYEVPRADFDKRLAALVDMLEIGEQIQRPTRQLSLGERMKCELCAALVHGPKVLFLDEPTIGLDVSMQGTMRNFIRKYNEETGATLILTSHDMDDVAALCPRVIVIDKGQLSYDGNLLHLAQQIRPEKRLTLRFSEPLSHERVATLGQVISWKPLEAVVQVLQAQLNQTVAEALAHFPLLDMNVENAPLEEVMSELFARGRERAKVES